MLLEAREHAGDVRLEKSVDVRSVRIVELCNRFGEALFSSLYVALEVTLSCLDGCTHCCHHALLDGTVFEKSSHTI